MITPVALTPELLLAKLKANPHPKQTLLEMAGGFAYITINGHKIAYNGEKWFACGQQITPQFSMNNLHQEIDRVFGLAQKIKAHVLDKTTTPTWEEIKADCVGPDLTTVEQKEQTTMTAEQLHNILSNHPHPDANNLTQVTSELMYFNVDGLWIGYDKGIWKAELHLKQYPITPNFPPFGELTVRDVHAEISRVVKIGKSLHANTRAVATETNTTPSPTSTWEQIKGTYWVGLDLETEQTDPNDPQPKRSWVRMPDGMTGCDVLNPEQTIKLDNPLLVPIDRYRELEAELAKMTASRDEVQKKNDFINGQMSDLLAERERLFEKIKGLTEERGGNESSYNYAQNLLNQVWDATGWLEKADNEPCGIEYLRRLKSKADRAGLLSVVCRRLCGDENASIETVHKALDLFDDQRNALDYIGEKVGSVPFHLGEVQSLVAQTVKSLGEKTVEVAKLQEGIKNYEAQLKGYAANKRLQILDRITKILRDAEIATVYDYDDNRAIETDEQVRILCERLNRFIVLKRDVLTTAQTIKDEIRQAHITLNDLNAARCMGTIDLSLPARIRSLFTTKV